MYGGLIEGRNWSNIFNEDYGQMKGAANGYLVKTLMSWALL